MDRRQRCVPCIDRALMQRSQSSLVTFLVGRINRSFKDGSFLSNLSHKEVHDRKEEDPQAMISIERQMKDDVAISYFTKKKEGNKK